MRPTVAATLLLSALPGACSEGTAEAARRETVGEARFRVAEVVTNPSATGVQLALVPAEPVELEVAFGPHGAEPASRTPRRAFEAGELAVFDLDGLEPGVLHGFRVWARPSGGQGELRPRAPGSFRTLWEGRGAEVLFAYTADSHITERWLAAECGGKPRARMEVEVFERTLAHLEALSPDFVIAGGDNFMTHSPALVSCGAWSEAGSGSARTPLEADRRYELALKRELWGRITPNIPFLYVLGNHDGEARFGDERGSYGHYPDLRELSRGARLRHLPDPCRVYDGSDDGSLYYTFATGDVRIVVLDVMAGPDDYPARPEDWTLGAAQLAWFERVLTANERSFTFVFAEHLAGGRASEHARAAERSGEPLRDYAYGRGGLLSTVDGTATGEFVGEQARLQELMSEHDVQLFFHGHDHMAVAGEKLAPDGEGQGVVYVMGGQASSLRARWDTSPEFRASLDYDGDGVADSFSGVNGTVERGFYRVRVIGGERAVVSYVASSAQNPEVDGRVMFSFEVLPDGTNTLPRPASER